jgi:2-dehydropantoate 2-reductase
MSGHTVQLIGPPGTGRGEILLCSSGAISGETSVTRMETTDPVNADVSVIAVKAYSLRAVSGAAGRSSDTVLCACNGMGLGEQWGTGCESVEPLVLTMGFNLHRTGDVEGFPGTVYAETGSRAEELFASAGLDVTPVADIGVQRWAKWLVNSVVNPFGALTGAVNCRLYSLGLEGVMNKVFRELEKVVPEAVRTEAVRAASLIMEYLTASSSNRCSMLQDLERGRETEIDFLTGHAERVKPGSCPLAQLLSDLVRARSRA